MVSCRQVEGTMAWEVRRGLDGMRKVVRENCIQGVHGVLIDLMDVMASLHCAVEVACPTVLILGAESQLGPCHGHADAVRWHQNIICLAGT